MEQSISDIVEAVRSELEKLEATYASTTLREKVLQLASLLKTNKHLNVAVVRANGCDAKSARDRIRLYLIATEGIVIDSIELEVVSGISEFARRVRELRVQHGYKIVTGSSNDPDVGIHIRPDQYLLLDSVPDRDAAHRWHLANQIRKVPGAAQDRLLEYLRQNVGHIVTTEELAYVGRISEWPRRVRELRTEHGYSIATKFTGRPDLRAGEYVLQTLERIAEEHDRRIPSEIQQEVYARDNSTCQICGGTLGRWTRPGSYLLELHHIKQHSHGGENLLDNLLVLCNACHDDVHANRAQIPAQWLVEHNH